jgi:hypothetical protein
MGGFSCGPTTANAPVCFHPAERPPRALSQTDRATACVAEASIWRMRRGEAESGLALEDDEWEEEQMLG